MKKKILKTLLFSFSLCLLLSSQQVLAHDEIDHPLNESLDKCLEKDSSTAGTHQCLDTIEPQWDAELNKYYKLLGGDQNVELRKAQQAWIAYRKAKTEWINKKYELIYQQNGGGTMYSLMAHGEVFEIVKDRALELKADYEALHEAD